MTFCVIRYRAMRDSGMGIGLMRGRERPQREVLAQVQGGRWRTASAARVLDLNQRQANTVPASAI